MKTAEEVCHRYTYEIVCPYCGYEYEDSWEFNETGEEQCDQCFKEFEYERETTVRYSTEKK